MTSRRYDEAAEPSDAVQPSLAGSFRVIAGPRYTRVLDALARSSNHLRYAMAGELRARVQGGTAATKMLESTKILLAYTGGIGLVAGAVIRGIRRGEVEKRALWWVVAVAVVFGALLSPMYWMHLQIERVGRRNQAHPQGPRKIYE